MVRKAASKTSESNKKVRYAVVGLGHIAQVAVMPAFETVKNAELTTIVSGDREKLAKLKKKYHLEQVYSYGAYDQALDTVDAVYIALPNHLHKEFAVRAAEAGVHVLCEKPMAPTVAECQHMIDAAERNTVKLMIAYRLHFEAGNLEAVRLASTGKLGELRIFSSEFAQQVAEHNVRVLERDSRGGGPLYDMGVYCINAARYLFQCDPVEVVALSANDGEKRFKNTEEMISVLLRFPSERLATFTCSFGAIDISRYALIGTKGLILADPAYEYAEGIKLETRANGKEQTRQFPKRDQFAAEISYFSDCVLKDREPEPSGLEGLADVRVVEAIYESIRSRGVVEIPEIEKKMRPTPGQEIQRPAHDEPQTVRAKPPSAA